MNPMIVVIDDNKVILKTIESFLKDSYQVTTFTSSIDAIPFIMNTPVDLLLIDIHMPLKDGYDLLKEIRFNPKKMHIPAIFMTADDNYETEVESFKLGAVDYIKKPIFKEPLLMRIKKHLKDLETVSGMQEALHVFQTEMERFDDQLLLSLSEITSLRDYETGNHIRRIAYYATLIASTLDKDNIFSEINPKFIETIGKASQFHDIGKIGIPDEILKKPGKLTKEEFDLMKTHTTLGEETIDKMITNESQSSFLNMAKEIALTHHEKWDGSGYPKGLKGETIPLSGRIVAIVDVYDALVSKRVYKPPFTHDEAVLMILKEKGTHFDPRIVDAFLKVQSDMKRIREQFKDDLE